MNDNAGVYAAFVDFRKAFDMVNRDMLLFRLLENGVDGKMYFAIKNIYNRASCAIRILYFLENKLMRLYSKPALSYAPYVILSYAPIFEQVNHPVTFRRLEKSYLRSYLAHKNGSPIKM